MSQEFKKSKYACNSDYAWANDKLVNHKTNDVADREHAFLIEQCFNPIDNPIFPVYGVPESNEGSTDYSDSAVYHALACEAIIKEKGIASAINYCIHEKIDPPAINDKAEQDTDLNSPVAVGLRLSSASWWERKLTIKRLRESELARLIRGIINKDNQAYCSDACVGRWEKRQVEGREYMNTLEIISEYGETASMEDVLEGSNSNPRIRRIELNKRIYGFVEYSKMEGHVFGFFTITAPSKYHSNSDNYNKWTPRQVHTDYLMPMWKQIRAELKRSGIQMYGFRFVEPHADGCPHWHMALFFENEKDREDATAIISDYALREDTEELKAKSYNPGLFELTDQVQNNLFSLIVSFNDLVNVRKRIFPRDFVRLASTANEFMKDVDLLRGSLPTKYKHFSSELKKVEGDLFNIANASSLLSIDLGAMKDRVKTVTNSDLPNELAVLKKRIHVLVLMLAEFDKWATVKSRNGDIKQKHKVRFDVEYVENAGAIVAYVTKYAGKNIDGKGTDDQSIGADNETGGDLNDTSSRVRAWASLWGVRQFQQLGGSSITVWRAMRRVKSFDNELLEEFRVEADEGNWEQYLALQGGALRPMRKQVVRPYYSTLNDAWTGNIKTSSYGEHVKLMLGVKIEGAGAFDCIQITKDTQWKLEKMPMFVKQGIERRKAEKAKKSQGFPWEQDYMDDDGYEDAFDLAECEDYSYEDEFSEPVECEDYGYEDSLEECEVEDYGYEDSFNDNEDAGIDRERSEPWLFVNKCTGIKISHETNDDLLLHQTKNDEELSDEELEWAEESFDDWDEQWE